MRPERGHFADIPCLVGYLIHEQTLCDPLVEIDSSYVSFKNTTFSVTIPTTVGPSGKHYVLMARILNTDGSYYGSSLESDVFELTGANGTWAGYQTEGYTLWGDDGTACSGFACVKNCSDAAANRLGAQNTTDYENCANICPDVSIDFENSTRGGQPTASLTTPSPCAALPSTSATTTPDVTGIDSAPTVTRSRSAAAAAGTSAASTEREQLRPCLIGLISFATVYLIG